MSFPQPLFVSRVMVTTEKRMRTRTTDSKLSDGKRDHFHLTTALAYLRSRKGSRSGEGEGDGSGAGDCGCGGEGGGRFGGDGRSRGGGV